MPHAAPDEPAAPTEDQMVRWLRALADAVERDPDLAARVAASTQGVDDGHPISDPPPRGVATTQGMEAGQPDCGGQTIGPSDPRGAEPPRSELQTPYGAVVGDEPGVVPAETFGDESSAWPAETFGDESSAWPTETIAPTLRHTRRSSRYGAPSVAGRPAELGTGVPDPFALFAASGEAGLRRALEAVRIGTLRAIIRAHALDPQGKLAPSATEKRLIAVILAAAKRGTGDAAQSKSVTTSQPSTPKKKRATKYP